MVMVNFKRAMLYGDFLAYFQFLKNTLLSALCLFVRPSIRLSARGWPILLAYGSIDS
jgi:hypothetical protein